MNDLADTPGPDGLATYWKEQIDTWNCSGISQIKFCQANDLSYHRFVYWRRKFEESLPRRKAAKDRGGFATVDYRGETNRGLTLSLPNGLVVHGICADNVPVVRQLLELL